MHSRLVALLLVIAAPLMAQPPQSASAADPAAAEKKNTPQLRFICVSALKENQDVVLATKDDAGQWQEVGAASLRANFVSEWLPAKKGALHLAERAGGSLQSIATWQYPDDCRRALVILIADEKTKKYNVMVVDPEKISLAKGSVLAINFSKTGGLLMLGTNKVTVASGQRVVAKPALEANGMYRLLVAYRDADDNAVPCFDRYLPGNPEAREMLFLFPDPVVGLSVFHLPMFGELD